MKSIILIFSFLFLINNVYANEELEFKRLLKNTAESVLDEQPNSSFLTTYNEEIYNFKLEQNKKAFQWQHVSSILIFCLVSIIVMMGLVLSYLQFKQSGDSNAKLELGKEGVKIDTAVIGLVILVISLSFFFMYLKYVYPINTVVID